MGELQGLQVGFRRAYVEAYLVVAQLNRSYSVSTIDEPLYGVGELNLSPRAGWISKSHCEAERCLVLQAVSGISR